MYKKFILSYLCIILVLLTSLSLSRPSTEKVRGGSAAFFSPAWEKLRNFKEYFSHPLQDGKEVALQEEMQHLELENQLLQNELTGLRHLLRSKMKIRKKLEELAEAEPDKAKELANHYQKALKRNIGNLKWQAQSLPAKVIFRSFDQWNSAVWINVGEEDNTKQPEPIIAKNSPVLIEQAVVGVVEYVGRRQSRVRLITDSGITPSVRAVRGGEQEGLMADYIDHLLLELTPKMAASLNHQEYTVLEEILKKLKETLNPLRKSLYLAKGELHGSLLPLGYGPPILKGTGFNYDFADEEGESRDLRTGKPLFSARGAAVPILKVNDLLVTTGMDGVFPPGLKVAVVSKIEPLKEGDYFYELEARPVAANLEELSLVFVIPPYRSEEREDE